MRVRLDIADGSAVWTTLAAADRAVTVPAGAVDSAELLRALREDASAVVELLAARGLAATPPFAFVATHEDGLRVIVRGAVEVTAETAAGPRGVSGRGVTAWTEQLLEAADDVEVRVDANAAEAAATTPDPAPAAAPAPTVAMPAVAEETIAAPFEPAMDTIVEYDDEQLFGATVVRPVGGEPAQTDDAGDHDGMTVLTDDIRDAVAASRAGAASPAAPSVVPPPAAYGLRMPDGSLEPIGDGAVIGRSPSIAHASGSRMPRPLTVGTGDPDISRSHVQIEMSGDTVVVLDLHSRNGTVLSLPGAAPRKLRSGEQATAVEGSTVDLGGGIVIGIERTT